MDKEIMSKVWMPNGVSAVVKAETASILRVLK